MGVCHFATTETKVHEVLVLDPFLDPDSHHYTLAESWVSLNEIFQSKIFEPTSLKGLSNGI